MDCRPHFIDRLQTSQTTVKKIFTRQEGSNQKGDYKINGSRIYNKNSSSRLASESRASIEKEHGRMMHVRRLHGSQ
jgi:hypothetical protein